LPTFRTVEARATVSNNNRQQATRLATLEVSVNEGGQPTAVVANKKQKTRYPCGYRVFLSSIALLAYWHVPLSVQMPEPHGQFVEAPGWQSWCQQLAQLAFAHV
jgi:hypothetical protein